MEAMANIMRREAARAASETASQCMAIVTAYDPATYSAKVMVQPEGYETDFIPIATPWSGANWGIFCPPSPGDVVDVHFQEGGKLAPYISLRFYGNVSPPLSVPSGEFWLVHRSGSMLKFHNDGSVEMIASTNLTITAGDTLRMTAPTIQVHATQEYKFDVNGHGQAWHPDRINTYQIGESPGTAHPISPPEIGD